MKRKKLKLEGGWQDQIISSFGGVQKININKKENLSKSWNIKNENLRKVEKKSFFFSFYKEVRNSSMIVKKQKKKKVINNYDVIKSKVTAFERFFKRGDTKKIGLLFHSHWIEKQKIAKEITNNNFNQIYKKMILSNLFYGGKNYRCRRRRVFFNFIKKQIKQKSF